MVLENIAPIHARPLLQGFQDRFSFQVRLKKVLHIVFSKVDFVHDFDYVNLYWTIFAKSVLKTLYRWFHCDEELCVNIKSKEILHAEQVWYRPAVWGVVFLCGGYIYKFPYLRPSSQWNDELRKSTVVAQPFFFQTQHFSCNHIKSWSSFCCTYMNASIKCRCWARSVKACLN